MARNITFHKSPNTYGRYIVDRPTKRIITPEHQRNIPYHMRHKIVVFQYPNGQIRYKRLNQPAVGVPIRSNMETIMEHAKYRRSPFKLKEIFLRRFGILYMNDNWRSWEQEKRLRKQMQARKKEHRVQLGRYLKDLPGCTVVKLGFYLIMIRKMATGF